ncbi:hypothetical protein HII12_001105 [Brettanomyces bruxellensis]|uniref:Protein FYV8 n=1 Tax=Dekkera bruxellensis TaxID=5007 RepID=A0A8H6EYQ7_DEKBR|nr:hypothetical protein HII12_001105 [Brettanomyces bruxellensis]
MSKLSPDSGFAYYEAYLQSMDDVDSNKNTKPRKSTSEQKVNEESAKQTVKSEGESDSTPKPSYPGLKGAQTTDSSLSEISASDIVGEYDDSIEETGPLSIGAGESKDSSRIENEQLGIPSGKVKSADDYMNDIETSLEGLKMNGNSLEASGYNDDNNSIRAGDYKAEDDEEMKLGEGESDEKESNNKSANSDALDASIDDDIDKDIVDDYGNETDNYDAVQMDNSEHRNIDDTAESKVNNNVKPDSIIDNHSNSSEDASSEADGSSGKESNGEEDGDAYSFLPNDDASSVLDHHLSNTSTGSLSTGVISRSVTEKDDALSEAPLPDSSDFRAKFIRMNTMDTVQTKGKDKTGTVMTASTVSTAIPEEETASERTQIPEPLAVNVDANGDDSGGIHSLTEGTKENENTIDSSMLEPLPEGEEYNNAKRSSTTTEDTTRNSGVTWESIDTKASSKLSSKSLTSSYSSMKSPPQDYSDWKIPELPSISVRAIMALPTSEERLAAFKKGRNDLLNFDSGLETFLRETVKMGKRPAISKDGQMGPNVKSAYSNSQHLHHRYTSSSVGSVTSELASDLIRRSSVLKQKGKNFFKKMHLKTAK